MTVGAKTLSVTDPWPIRAGAPSPWGILGYVVPISGAPSGVTWLLATGRVSVRSVRRPDPGVADSEALCFS